MAFFMLTAVVVDAGRRRGSANRTRAGQGRWEIGWWAGGVAAAAIAIVLIYLPYRAQTDLRASESDVNAGRLDSALSEARSAADLQPYAASPRLQEALVLERQGKYDEAAAAAREATQKESTNWRTFFVLSRVEAERGDAKGSLAAFRRAKQLNPHSGVFAG
jgi:tetratricopeptide (TPR) repeat protein